MKNLQAFMKVSAVTLAVFIGVFAGSTGSAYAQWSDGCALCGDAGYTDYSYFGDAGYTDYGYYDSGYTDYGYTNPGYTDYGYYDSGYTDYGYVNPGYTDYGYYDAGYTDYGYTNPGYTDYGYYGAGYTDYGYSAPTWPTGGMNWGGYTSSPIYGGYGYSTGGGYYGGGYSTPIPTWPTGFGRVGATPSVVGTPSNSHQTQSQSSVQANEQIQNNPVTVTQNQAPISNINNNIINVPAPVVYTTPTTPVYYNNPVSCIISASPSSVQYGQYTYLNWSAYNASSATLSDIGAVTTSGSRAIQVNGSRIYTLTVYGAQGQSATCQTQVYVGGTYTVPTTGSYVSLSQIPYTGFDFGTVGNAIYWALLATFAVALAYLALYYRGGFALATATARPTTRQQVEQYMKERTSAQETAPAAPRMSVLEYLPTVAERRNATTDSMSVMTSSSADEMPRIVINRS